MNMIHVDTVLPKKANIGDMCIVNIKLKSISKVVDVLHVFDGEWHPVIPNIDKDFIIQTINDADDKAVLLDSDMNEYIIRNRTITKNEEPVDVISVLAKNDLICLVLF